MISNKGRDRRTRGPRISKNLEQLCRVKCRDCSVVVTRMDFAKILGKFTKVKIQYESNANTTPKAKRDNKKISPNTNSRLRSNENGMVLIHRNAYNEHPVKELLNSKKTTNEHPTKEILNAKNTITNEHPVKELLHSKKTSNENFTRQVSNVLKENNRLRKPANLKDRDSNFNKKYVDSTLKQYNIVFLNPTASSKIDIKNKLSLKDLLPDINKSVLPSVEWCIEYLPKSEEPREDKVYDRIAAELEDLMYNDKTVEKSNASTENKADDFPSIMDILNDNTGNASKSSEHNAIEFKSNLESSDVEAILLGKSNEDTKVSEPAPMDIDNNVIDNLMNDVGLSAIQDIVKNSENDKVSGKTDDLENPQSPSILDEALQETGVDEHLTSDETQNEAVPGDKEKHDQKQEPMEIDSKDNIIPETQIKLEENDTTSIPKTVTHIVFSNKKDGVCHKSVTCPKNLKYSVLIDEKPVEFLGAPKYVSSLEDLQVLLQIVHESDINSFYVLH